MTLTIKKTEALTYPACRCWVSDIIKINFLISNQSCDTLHKHNPDLIMNFMIVGETISEETKTRMGRCSS